MIIKYKTWDMSVFYQIFKICMVLKILFCMDPDPYPYQNDIWIRHTPQEYIVMRPGAVAHPA